jgi:hypothetical protein
MAERQKKKQKRKEHPKCQQKKAWKGPHSRKRNGRASIGTEGTSTIPTAKTMRERDTEESSEEKG